MHTGNQSTTHQPDPEGINEAILNRFDCYIAQRARLLVYHYSPFAHPGLLDMEADELVQRVRIKFWQALNKYHIEYPRAYLKRIIYSEFSDMKRQQNAHPPLPLDESWVGCQLDQFENAPDPADEIEQRLEGEELLEGIIQMILHLPPRQRTAIICFLLDQIDDPAYLTALFKAHKVNIEALQWPHSKAERKLLQASLYIARQTLARNLHIDLHTRKRRRA